MRITYDAEVDALYIQLRPDPVNPDSSIDVAPSVTADLDAQGRVVGIEVLDLRATFGVAAIATVTLEGLGLDPTASKSAIEEAYLITGTG